MGKVVSMMIRPIRNINVEQRAHKIISKEKPVPAPRYEANLKQLELAKELDPTFIERQSKKNSRLDKHLKNVYVLSKDPMVDLHNRTDPTKPLPKSRKAYEYDYYNYFQTENVKEGKCSLQQVQTFLTNHMDDPEKYNATNIADQYHLDREVVENILEYYKVFRMISSDDLNEYKEREAQKLLEEKESFQPPNK